MTGMETSFALALFTGILEVTAGCLNASALGGEQGFLLCAFLVSFSSLSILFQVRSCFPVDSPVQFRRLAGSRFLHGALTTGFASLLFRLLHFPQAIFPERSFPKPLPTWRLPPFALSACVPSWYFFPPGKEADCSYFSLEFFVELRYDKRKCRMMGAVTDVSLQLFFR